MLSGDQDLYRDFLGDTGGSWERRLQTAALRLVRQQLRFADIGDGDYGPEVIAGEKHRALAREVAARGIVLLRNEPIDGRPVLPFRAGAGDLGAGDLTAGNLGAVAVAGESGARSDAAAPPLRRLAVIGRLAGVPNTGDHGSSNVTPPYVVTPLAGLRAALEPLGVEVLYDDGALRDRATALAATTDAAIVVAGYDFRDEGEFMSGILSPELRSLLPRPSA